MKKHYHWTAHFLIYWSLAIIAWAVAGAINVSRAAQDHQPSDHVYIWLGALRGLAILFAVWAVVSISIWAIATRYR